MSSEYADQRAHDVAWMTAAERDEYENRLQTIREARSFGEVTTCRHCHEPIHLAFVSTTWQQVWSHEVAKGCHTVCNWENLTKWAVSAKTVAEP